MSHKISSARILLIFASLALLALTGCGGQERWYPISSIKVSADQQTIVAELLFGDKREDGTFCEKVVDTKVTESASHVVIGVRVENPCGSLFPWEERPAKDIGYAYPVQLHLTQPLAQRTVRDKSNDLKLPVTND
ncbi:hypothetical protein ACQP2T_15855 [Nonomuraea sp. CA-143628]|uniref:hypothetical protein n=1 Tax=Nonomuraea sp. CA-143628 TaxID=3239997 RepID=UPI003D919942